MAQQWCGGQRKAAMLQLSLRYYEERDEIVTTFAGLGSRSCVEPKCSTDV